MKTRIAIVVGLATAIAAILWLKPSGSTPGASPADRSESPAATPTATVVLVADPREAEASCGCAEVIRIARAAADVPGVRYEEIDPRSSQDTAQRYGVRVVPAVLIIDAAGAEQARFEGESSSVIAQLRDAVAALHVSTDGTRQ